MAYSNLHILLLAFVVFCTIPGYLGDSSSVPSSNEQNNTDDESSNVSSSNEHNITDDVSSILDSLWGKYKGKYDRNYEGDKDDHKKSLFHMNILDILSHNLKFLAGENTFKQVVNKYADVNHTKFVHTMNGFNLEQQKTKFGSAENGTSASGGKKLKASKSSLPMKTFKPPTLPIPASVDWRTKGAVTSVKDQGSCGSCYTFSAAGALEGQEKIKKGKLVNLSEQNLVDCSQPQGNSGCDGGIMDSAFEYVHVAGGIDTNVSYPYTGTGGTCAFKRKNIAASITGIVKIPEGDEKALMNAVGTVGPVSVAIDASQPSIQFYESGVYFEPACTDNVDHGVLCVGYGTENGLDYWLVKNSWGPDWGLGGYIKMARNKNNHCGIASIASYPVM